MPPPLHPPPPPSLNHHFHHHHHHDATTMPSQPLLLPPPIPPLHHHLHHHHHSTATTTTKSFLYLVGVCAAVAAHSVLQLLISTSRLLRKSLVIHSRKHAWLIFVGDQAFAYALMSAGSAASGVTNLNRTGIRHSALPNFCKPLHSFCDRVAVSIAFTFVSCFLLAASAVFDVIWLSRY
ncbi:hypothetical protein RHGRI_035320 [Rhododendron griersonianum]|uniref:CASP-like protein n=1 Tax=Rhododendron griersonianum TaxID=479676 RepID=A0AAV6I4K4_9ERIC|nr:hypothetical protein RHGRI_035320 [Rhododendron griersonianum]